MRALDEGKMLKIYDANVSKHRRRQDMFVTKMDTGLNHVWTWQGGTNALDYAQSIQLDADENIILGGTAAVENSQRCVDVHQVFHRTALWTI